MKCRQINLKKFGNKLLLRTNSLILTKIAKKKLGLPIARKREQKIQVTVQTGRN